MFVSLHTWVLAGHDPEKTTRAMLRTVHALAPLLADLSMMAAHHEPKECRINGHIRI
ncbi:hypothetical protein AB0395_39320 [Streptosporangium sp. NPDC051023]|uniref:hypothetical protein n=1 Tax=Streptosporangium sp. NPDC051023 TaxID=3155410 RepID=UPI00344DF1B2